MNDVFAKQSNQFIFSIILLTRKNGQSGWVGQGGQNGQRGGQGGQVGQDGQGGKCHEPE